MARRIHLFPCRTQKLSFLTPRVVGGKLPARVGSRRAKWRISSAGRASALQAGGHRFEPCILHRSWTTEYGSLFLCLKINERNFVYIVIRLRSRKDSFFSVDAL